MCAKTSDCLSRFCSRLGESVKSVAKMALHSRRHTVTCADRGGRELVIMGNGPSLAHNIADNHESLRRAETMAVNFAANAEEFASLTPRYYLLADPHFFSPSGSDPNVDRLYNRLETVVTWPMTLYVPVGASVRLNNPSIRIERFNFVGVEGFDGLENWAYRHGLGMPRPRNVLIPAIMTGMLAGYRRIVIIGADHSWLRTLSVDDANRVVTVQPHFYKDSDVEKERVTAVYRDVRLHDILMSFHVAFKSYHTIGRYARSTGVEIINSTPGSFIDAFTRKPFPDHD